MLWLKISANWWESDSSVESNPFGWGIDISSACFMHHIKLQIHCATFHAVTLHCCGKKTVAEMARKQISAMCCNVKVKRKEEKGRERQVLICSHFSCTYCLCVRDDFTNTIFTFQGQFTQFLSTTFHIFKSCVSHLSQCLGTCGLSCIDQRRPDLI